ncbi:MAG: aspartate kinase [Bacteroidales bacterium]|nr:aspartate kinase [Bacteroidales bacterium]
MIVYKFGGASVNSADAVRNMAGIISRCTTFPLMVVVSAMGKTTNALEQLIPGVCPTQLRQQRMAALRDYHCAIADELMAGDAALHDDLEALMEALDLATQAPATTYNDDYDSIVSYGELLSTTIISHYLRHCGMDNRWLDVRQLIFTDANHREGHVDWPATTVAVGDLRRQLPRLSVTQGFIAGAPDGTTTTLGREGSDYSAAILSYCLDAESMTIWKDVPGFLNADPKFFPDTIKIDSIPYNEAIELAYYGASVIHPKTVKPLKNKNIPLFIKSFLSPEDEGSAVGPYQGISPETPLYIVRHAQVLISISSKDFSFIAEHNLQTIFGIFSRIGVRINVMQNSALSFSVCIDHNEVLLKQLIEALQTDFHVRYNTGLQLITIRYYTQAIIDHIVAGRPVLLEQRSRNTEQVVVEG